MKKSKSHVIAAAGILLIGMMLFMTGCASGEKQASAGGDDIIGMPNPFVDYDSLEEALKHLDFDVIVPEKIEGYDEVHISVMDDSMFQIVYRNEEDEICIRKARGDEDISGDYNEYSEVSEVEIGNVIAVIKGENDKARNITWSDSEFAYSIYSEKGIEKSFAEDLVGQIDAVGIGQ